MNLFKRATATVALVTLVSGIFSTGAYASSSTEIEAANALAAAGYIVDHSDDTAAYNLNQNVLRQEIAAVARAVAGLDKKTTCDDSFKDVSATTPNTWACYSVEALLDAGLIAANENFRPEANITKAEAVGMMVKAAFGDEYAYDSTLGTSWQEQVVDFAVAKGVIADFTNYNTPATRGFVFEAGNEAI
ncbi:MAG: S-layer homology domain-containing protein, partial [Candidatus Gracilibacteria bacterium]|nr:S-layer homology domain-containing protein [Candidatus Gracilibacteria bacterium]